MKLIRSDWVLFINDVRREKSTPGKVRDLCSILLYSYYLYSNFTQTTKVEDDNQKILLLFTI